MKINEVIVDLDLLIIEKLKDVIIATQVENILELTKLKSKNFNLYALQVFPADDIYIIVTELVHIQQLLRELPYKLTQTEYITEKLLQYFD